MIRALKRITFAAALAAICVMLTVPADAGAFARRTYYAAVNASGAKARGTTGVKSVRKGTGFYVVTFPVKVTTCAYVATVGFPTPSRKPPKNTGGVVGQITPVRGKPGSLFVVTSSSGKLANRGFYLVVTC